MTTPFYVSPEQWYQDKAEYARKGIARGKPIVALNYVDGIVLIAENPSTSLRKISEIYDRIAFAGVGKFDEYENLRKSGVRYADLRGYSYCREDVAAKNLANEYSTVLGGIFTREMKPFEVEILVVEVGDGADESSMYKILFDGAITDHRRFAAIGDQADDLLGVLRDGWREGMDLQQAVKFGRDALGQVGNGASELAEHNLEIAVVDRNREGRKFSRLPSEAIAELLSE
jgi:proteasome alpha subunit